MIHNLEDSTLAEISNVISEYRKAEETLNRLEAEVLRMDAERKQAIALIENAREREDAIIENLQKKYGKGKLDPITMVYISKNEDYVDMDLDKG